MTLAPAIGFTGRFHLNEEVLFEADLRLLSGGWTCLLGRSGVGKSTILRLILGLETGGQFEGSIVAGDGLPLKDRISYMAQTDLLLPWLSVLDNICIGARLRGERPDFQRAEALLRRVGLFENANKKPNMLSGGMRQRAALARTLFEDRPIVLLDEPFSALDAGTRADMQELAAEVLEGRTVLLVTHDPAEASRLAQQIIVMSAQKAQVWPVPKTPVLRDINDLHTLECQSQLLTHLREATG